MEKYLQEIMNNSFDLVLEEYKKETVKINERRSESSTCVRICGCEAYSIYKTNKNNVNHTYYTVKLKDRKLWDIIQIIDYFLKRANNATQPFYVIEGSMKPIYTDCAYVISDNRMTDHWAVKTKIEFQNQVFRFNFILEGDINFDLFRLQDTRFNGPDNKVSEIVYWAQNREKRKYLMDILKGL